MPQPEGEELAAIRAKRDELRERYVKPLADRGGSPTRGVHHIALICKDVEETIRFYQEFLGFPLFGCAKTPHPTAPPPFSLAPGPKTLGGLFDSRAHAPPPFSETIGAVQ